jgi:hypothetical protein
VYQVDYLSSSNLLFVDYAISDHNNFSMKDNFQRMTDSDGTPHFLYTALCNHIVVPWHSGMTDDPFGTVKDKTNADDTRGRLTRFLCAAQAHLDGK